MRWSRLLKERGLPEGEVGGGGRHLTGRIYGAFGGLHWRPCRCGIGRHDSGDAGDVAVRVKTLEGGSMTLNAESHDQLYGLARFTHIPHHTKETF